ncbi:hydroxymethylpyrimidine kinase /phosphomethylpyrimidine kinase [Jannaschia faecimaris]|uniref:hydroxymethylpyrimidine kinase n=1 Tax=Jannaschia faecimaris TaxID=1244108 RepID=A0A1H3TC43_9RHOB|nr:bifunctional hydroxymethylpyrimidine kinase/phosphomethylpyrimidine kinase [Jannaschia faecimaris]SDZ47842.1 hydroxymethylpyrimidine kinase /phosphomethylpyrimidine kinase [Jannaschia faecimaris]
MIANVLSIAGSDPSGGAGIQADLKSIAANGAYGMAVLTALTAQNTQGVSGVHRVPPAFVADQIKAVFDDVRVDAVKIGMILDAEIAGSVADALSGLDVVIVLDPVMIAKGGASLLNPEAVAVLRDRLLPLATVLTPNLPEAAALLGAEVAEVREEMAAQGRALRTLGPEHVLMKGGHGAGAESSDCLVSDCGVTWFDAPRIATKNTHGTGCSLSAALAAQLGQGRKPQEAVRRAKAFITDAIAGADDLTVGSGHGPIHHFVNLWR